MPVQYVTTINKAGFISMASIYFLNLTHLLSADVLLFDILHQMADCSTAAGGGMRLIWNLDILEPI